LSAADLLVLVDDEPAVARPGIEVLTEDLGEDVDILGRRRNSAEMLAKTDVAVGDDGTR
jgi:hypothetical protein